MSSLAGAPPTAGPQASESRVALRIPKQASVDSGALQQRQVEVSVLHQKHFSMDSGGSHFKQSSMDVTSSHQRQVTTPTVGEVGVSHHKQISLDIASIGHQRQVSADTETAQQPKQLGQGSGPPSLTKQDTEFVNQNSTENAAPSLPLVSPFRSPKQSRRTPIPILLNNGSELTSPDQRSPLLSRQPLTRAHSTQALDKTPQNEDKSVKHRSYTFTGELGVKEIALPPANTTVMSEGDGDDTLVSSEEDSMLMAISSPSSFSTPGEGVSEIHVAMGNDQVTAGPDQGTATTSNGGSATPARPFSVRTSSAGLKKDLSDNSICSKTRPRSMIETSCGMQYHPREVKTTPPDVLAQLFWTACSLLESDYEDEFLLALKLFSKVRTCAVKSCGEHVT